MLHFILKQAKAVLGIIVDIVYQPGCIICNKKIDSPHRFCPECWKGVEFISSIHCPRCSMPYAVEYSGQNCYSCGGMELFFDCSRAVMRYTGPMQRLIKDIKFHDKTNYARSFAHMMLAAGRSLVQQCDLIVPVPMHYKSIRKRKYNHALLIARVLSKLSDKKLLPHTLIKLHERPTQASLNRDARLTNLIGAFGIAHAANELKGANVLLVDDVMTTCATANECARTLKKAGVKKVVVLTLCRTY